MRNHVDKPENNTRGGRLLCWFSELSPVSLYYHSLREGFVQSQLIISHSGYRQRAGQRPSICIPGSWRPYLVLAFVCKMPDTDR